MMSIISLPMLAALSSATCLFVGVGLNHLPLKHNPKDIKVEQIQIQLQEANYVNKLLQDKIYCYEEKGINDNSCKNYELDRI